MTGTGTVNLGLFMAMVLGKKGRQFSGGVYRYRVAVMRMDRMNFAANNAVLVAVMLQ